MNSSIKGMGVPTSLGGKGFLMDQGVEYNHYSVFF